LPPGRVPRSETFERSETASTDGRERAFVKLVVERWRNAMGGGVRMVEDTPAPALPPAPPSYSAPPADYDFDAPPRTRDNAVAQRLEQLRSQIMKRSAGGGLRS
jgi:hypothetical protein